MSVDLSNAWNSGERIINTAISLLPNALLALAILGVTVVVAGIARSLVRRVAWRKQKRMTLSILLGQIVQTAIGVLGFLIAFSVVAPSFHAADLVKMLGIGSVAIGFAFQNILQNFLAGVLLLLHEPFKLGDLINVTSVPGLEGTVEDIQTRATIVTTPEGHRIFIPNAILFTNAVVVTDREEKTSAPETKPMQTSQGVHA